MNMASAPKSKHQASISMELRPAQVLMRPVKPASKAVVVIADKTVPQYCKILFRWHGNNMATH